MRVIRQWATVHISCVCPVRKGVCLCPIGSEAWEEYSSGLLSLIDFVLSVWEERLCDEHTNAHQSHSQNDSGDLRGVAGGDGVCVVR